MDLRSPNDTSDEKQNHTASKWVSNCLTVVQLLPRPPQLFRPPFSLPVKTNPQQVLAPEACRLVPNLHNSIVFIADKCLSLLHEFPFLNPLLGTVLSLSSDFHNTICQISCRNYKNLNNMSKHNFAAILPGDSVAGVVVANGILNFLNIYNTLLVVRLVLTWFPNTPPAIVSPLSTLCDPYLNIFRGIIPPLGGTLDLSPILAFLVLNAFTSTAAALPAELPSAAASQEIPSYITISDMTTSQKKWMRRLTGNRSESSKSNN